GRSPQERISSTPSSRSRHWEHHSAFEATSEIASIFTFLHAPFYFDSALPFALPGRLMLHAQASFLVHAGAFRLPVGLRWRSAGLLSSQSRLPVALSACCPLRRSPLVALSVMSLRSLPPLPHAGEANVPCRFRPPTFTGEVARRAGEGSCLRAKSRPADETAEAAPRRRGL